jgi:hypothetical protein
MLGEEPADLEVGLIESQSPTSPVNKPSEIQPQQQPLFIQADDNLLDVPSPVENDLSVKQQPEPQEWFNPLKPRS